jgi:hypothetical protein
MAKRITPESRLLTERIIEMRDAGVSWRAIGETIGLTPTSAQERYKHARGIDTVPALREEVGRLRRALARVKKIVEELE